MVPPLNYILNDRPLDRLSKGLQHLVMYIVSRLRQLNNIDAIFSADIRGAPVPVDVAMTLTEFDSARMIVDIQLAQAASSFAGADIAIIVRLGKETQRYPLALFLSED